MILLVLALQLTTASAVRPPVAYRTVLGEDLGDRASRLNAQGRYREVVELVERFEDEVESLAPLSYEAGYALNRLGEMDQALSHYTAAIQRDPELARARYDRGEIYLSRAQWTEAAADFEVVVRVQPGHWAGHFRMAHLAGVAGDPVGLEKHLTDAIRTGFDLRVVAEDSAWRSWAKDPQMGAALRKIIIMYTDESLLKELGLEP